MPKYRVEFSETVDMSIEIEAENEDDVVDKYLKLRSDDELGTDDVIVCKNTVLENVMYDSESYNVVLMESNNG